jgi:hypothetical protein
MANTFLTPQIIAQEALAILRNQLIFADLVHTDYANEFVKVGDTITVRKPAELLAKDFSGSIAAQDLTESGVTVKLDRFKDVSVAITSQQASLELRDFARQVIEPAMVALAQKIDEDIANFAFEKASGSVLASSATPTNLANIAEVGKKLDIAKAPLQERHLVMHPEHKYRYALTEILSKVNYAGSNETLREALLGKVYGMQTYMDQNLPSSTASAAGTQVGTMSVASSSDSGEVDLSALGLATGTLAIGEGFVYNGILYRFTEAVTAVSNAKASVAVSPAFPSGVSATSVRILRESSSLGFHKNAFAFVIRPLDLPMGAARASVVNGEGLSVRVVYGYDQNSKTDTISFDVLYGIAALRPELAVAIQDTY